MTEAEYQSFKNDIESNESFYREKTAPLLELLSGKKKRGTYRKDEAFDFFVMHADSYARRLARVQGIKAKDVIGDDDKNRLASEWILEFETEYPKGTYDNLALSRSGLRVVRRT